MHVYTVVIAVCSGGFDGQSTELFYSSDNIQKQLQNTMMMEHICGDHTSHA